MIKSDNTRNTLRVLSSEELLAVVGGDGSTGSSDGSTASTDPNSATSSTTGLPCGRRQHKPLAADTTGSGG